LVKTTSNGGKCKDQVLHAHDGNVGIGWVLTQKTGEDNDKDARWKRVEGDGRENGSPRAEATPFNDRFRRRKVKL